MWSKSPAERRATESDSTGSVSPREPVEKIKAVGMVRLGENGER